MKKIIIGLLLIGLVFICGCTKICPYCYEYTENDGSVVCCDSATSSLFKEGHTLSYCDNNKRYIGVTEYKILKRC